MKIFYFLFFLFASCFAAETKDCVELLKFTFDDRDWVPGFDQSTPEGAIIEYTLKGETVDNWSELVTVQRFVNVKANVNEYYSLFIKELQKSVKPAEVHTRVISRDAEGIFFEWWIDKGEPTAQHEWFRLFKTPESLLILRYTTKQLDDLEKTRETWEKILKRATISEECS